MLAVAIKKGSREKTLDFQEMGTVRCDGCGEEFFIGHDPQSADRRVAERQARWLEKFWRKSTSATGSTLTESNYRTSTIIEGRFSQPWCGSEIGKIRSAPSAWTCTKVHRDAKLAFTRLLPIRHFSALRTTAQ